MKALRPSMREGKRYLYLKGNNLKKNFEEAILDFVGILGYSKAMPNVIKSGKDWMIISINREAINEIRASFALWADRIEVLKVSGTLKSLKKQ